MSVNHTRLRSFVRPNWLSMLKDSSGFVYILIYPSRTVDENVALYTEYMLREEIS